MQDVPARVVALIDRSGLSRRAFARQVGLDDSKLSKSISGARRFSSLDLARIAEFGQVSVDWLVTGQEPALAVAARTMFSVAEAASGAIEVAKRYATLRADIAFLGYAQPWTPVPTGLPGGSAALPGGSAALPGGSAAGQGERLAGQALARVAELGQPVVGADLPLLTEEAFGADVAIAELGAGFDGLAASSAEAKLIVLATSRIPARQRYTLAHELGHLLAGDDQGIHLDKDVYDGSGQRDASEVRANSFAASFLMPEELLRAAAERTALTEQDFAALACDLEVSPSALAIRLRQLRLVDEGACDRYARLTGAKAAAIAGRGEEFAVRVTVANTTRLPGLLVRDTYAAYESGAATLRPYANLLGVDVDELAAALESRDGAATDS